MKLFLNCDEAYQSCDKNQYKEASFWEQMKLSIHLIYCAACKKYSIRNSKLTNALTRSNIKTMPRTDKQSLKIRLHQEISKQE
jgi:hypothetical protein